jgi:hypothetical protein
MFTNASFGKSCKDVAGSKVGKLRGAGCLKYRQIQMPIDPTTATPKRTVTVRVFQIDVKECPA